MAPTRPVDRNSSGSGGKNEAAIHKSTIDAAPDLVAVVSPDQPLSDVVSRDEPVRATPRSGVKVSDGVADDVLETPAPNSDQGLKRGSPT